jgi:hypothetical protein
VIAITPYEAVGDVRFGMSRDQVIAALGSPKMTTRDRGGNVLLVYGTQDVTIGPEGMVEASFVPGAPVMIAGVDVFTDPDAFLELCRIDGAPKEMLGFVIFLNLGLTMTGFHDLDESQKAVTAFARGRWDVLLSELKDFRVER